MPILVRLPPDLLAAIDAWIDEEAARVTSPGRMSRPQALRRLAEEALTTLGLYRPR